MNPFPILPTTVALMAVYLGSALDVRSFRVPNWLTLPLIGAGFLYHSFQGIGSLTNGTMGFLFMTLVFFPLWLRGGIGAGDVKLAMGIGTWLGMPWALYAFAGAGVLAGLYALAYLLMGREFVWSAMWTRFPAGQTIADIAASPKRNSRITAFAPFMAGGLTAAWILSMAISF